MRAAQHLLLRGQAKAIAEHIEYVVGIQGEIEQVVPYGLELPGSNDEPGHRDIPARDFPLTEVRRGVQEAIRRKLGR